MSLARVGFVIGTAALSFKFLKPETKAQLRRQVSAGLRIAANAIDPNYKQPMWADGTKKEVDDASIQHEIENISLEIEGLLNDEDDTNIPSNKERTFRGFRIAN
jgi:hypothetical protein